jgi:hypothetical protein
MDASGNNKSSSDVFSIMLNTVPVAYVRPVDTDQGVHYAVCTADGTQLAIFASQDAAYFAAKQHDLEPMLIH